MESVSSGFLALCSLGQLNISEHQFSHLKNRDSILERIISYVVLPALFLGDCETPSCALASRAAHFNDSAMASWLRLFLWGLSLGKMTNLRSLLSELWDWGGCVPFCGRLMFRWVFWLLAKNGKARPRSSYLSVLSFFPGLGK